jgi:hypothetical protein
VTVSTALTRARRSQAALALDPSRLQRSSLTHTKLRNSLEKLLSNVQAVAVEGVRVTQCPSRSRRRTRERCSASVWRFSKKSPPSSW